LRCDAMRCDAMRCDAMRCDAMLCYGMQCDAMLCSMLRHCMRRTRPSARRGTSRRRLMAARAIAAGCARTRAPAPYNLTFIHHHPLPRGAREWQVRRANRARPGVRGTLAPRVALPTQQSVGLLRPSGRHQRVLSSLAQRVRVTVYSREHTPRART
jgi:hypothetical protein